MPKEKSPDEYDLKNDGQNWRYTKSDVKLNNLHQNGLITKAKFLNHQQSAVSSTSIAIVFQNRQHFPPSNQ